MFKSKHCIIFPVAIIALVSYAYSSDDLGILALKAFEQDVRPVLEKHCFNCHGLEKQKGKVRLDTLNPDLVNSTSAETWHDALDNINLGEMPPEDEPAISDQDRRVLTDWISGELKRASQARRSTGGKTVLRRLNRYEYANTLRDLLGLDLDFARTLPPEPASPDGFKNNGRSLRMSPEQLEYYLQIARDALDKVIVEGEAPVVVKGRTEKSEKVRRIKGLTTNELLPGSQFLAKFSEFPREGEFQLKISATAKVPKGQGLPVLHISMGVRADVKASQLTLATVDVAEGEQEIVLGGRIEDFPLPGHNPKFPGLLVRLTNQYDDGSGFIKLDDKKKQKLLPEELRSQPTINVHSVDFQGPIFDTWPPESHRQLIGTSEDTNEPLRARSFLKKFMTRAWRRPVDDAEVDDMYTLFEKLRSKEVSFEAAIRETFALVLVSPEFLYLVEPASVDGKRRDLTQHEVATRLSYLLWSTMPDAELFKLADSGRLLKPAELERQVNRMITDKRSWDFVQQFTDQWLNLSGLTRVAVNPQFYPQFDDELKADMRLEPQYFFNEILREDLSALQLIDSDFAMLNRSLASHYGIDGPRGNAFERVSLNTSHKRGGLLTQAGILLANSDGEQSHPIRRAVWLLDRFLGDPPAPPPPDVPELEDTNPKHKNLSIREQMEVHREKAACANCHRDIDPWGIAFEQYDAVGLWRDNLRTHPKAKPQPVDAQAKLPDGEMLDGMVGLKKHLLKIEKDKFARALTAKLLTYALGRSLDFSDEETIDVLATRFAKDDYRIRSLLVAIVTSEAFLRK